MNNTQVKKKTHKRKFEGDENQHRYIKSQKLVRERNRKAKLRKNPAMSIFEAGRERTKRIVKKEYPSINLNKPPSSIASLSNYTPRNKKNDEKSNKNDKDSQKSTIYRRTTFRLPIREPSAQNFDMYYYLAPNCEPATVKNILELYDETKSKLLQKKKALKSGVSLKSSDKTHLSAKESSVKDKENDINVINNKNVLGNSKSNNKNIPFSNKENLPKKANKENKGILTKSNMNASNILKSSTKGNKKLKDGKALKSGLDDNKENIPPLHHNQFNSSLNLQFVDFPSGNGIVTSITKKLNNNQEELEKSNTLELSKVKKEVVEGEGREEEEEEKNKENIKENNTSKQQQQQQQQRKTKPIVVNTVSDEDLEEFFRVFDDLIPMYRSSTQLQEVIFETSQKEWNEWCYKVEQCEEETHSWLDARIMFYSRRIIEYQKDWAEYWNKKKKKEKEMLELTSDLFSDGLCPNTPSSTPILSDPIKILGSSPLPSLPMNGSTTVNNFIPFQTPDESTSMLISSETTPTKTTVNTTTNTALTNMLIGNEDIDLNTFSLDSNSDLLSNMSLLYDTTNGQTGYPNLDYGLDSTSSFDSLDPLSNATVNNEYCSWLSSNPSSSLSMDDIIFNPAATPSDPNYSLLLNSLQPSTTNATAVSTTDVDVSLNFLNPLDATLNPALSIFDTNYTTTPSAITDNLIIPPSLVNLPSVSSTASLIDSFANLNPSESKGKEGEKEGEGDANALKNKIKTEEEVKEVEVKGKVNATLPSTTGNVDVLGDPAMASLLSTDLGLDFLFNEKEAPKLETALPTPPTATTTMTTATATATATTTTTTTTTNQTEETPKMTIKTVTEALITPTKPKEPNPTIDFFVDNTNNKKTSEFATPLYIKPPSADTFSSIPKSYQEMYNDKMYSLISTLERCVQDKEDFWKVMEEFTSSINTHSSPIAC